MVATKWEASCMPMLTDKLAVVTGANSGIGFYTALALANKQAHVILACRNEERGRRAQQEIREETHNTNVEYMQLDLGSLDSIRSFSNQFHAKFDHLDLLINNAGVMNASFAATSDGFEAHFGVNYLSHFYLTSLLFDSLKASKAARIVGLSSLAHRGQSADFTTTGFPPRGHSSWLQTYGISKLAVNLFTFELQRRLQAAGIDNIKAIAAHPGVAMTNLMQLPGWLTKVTAALTSCVFQSAEQAAQPSLFAATDESIEGGEFIGPTGFREMSGTPARVEPSAASRSEEDAVKLWARSEELLHCQFNVE